MSLKWTWCATHCAPTWQSVKVGDKVLLPEYGGAKFEFDNEEFHVFRDEDIVGILS